MKYEGLESKEERAAVRRFIKANNINFIIIIILKTKLEGMRNCVNIMGVLVV